MSKFGRFVNFCNSFNAAFMRAFGQVEQQENSNEIADRFQTPPTRTRSAKFRADRVSRIQEARENGTMIVSI